MLDQTDQSAVEQMAVEYRLEDGRLLWANKRKSSIPNAGDILTNFLSAGGNGSVAIDDIQDALKAHLAARRATTQVIRRQRALSGYDVDILKGVRWAGVEGQVRIFLVADRMTRTVVTVEDPRKIHQCLAANHLLAEYDTHYNKVIDRAELRGELNLISGVNTDGDGRLIVPTYEEYLSAVVDTIHTAPKLRISEPVRLSNNPKTVNFTYFDLGEIKTGYCEDWLDWELSMPDYCRPVWRAWFYSIFVASNEGRQLCWLNGQGFDGKSQVGKAIRRVLGANATASVNKSAMENQFGFSAMYGKRFILYGDCRNPNVTHSEKVHQITGGDIVSIEFKNQTPFAGKVYGKMLICANTEPSIHFHERNERSRIIYIPLNDPPERVRKKFNLVDEDGNLVKRYGQEVGTGYPLADRMVEQAYAYLAECQPYYQKLCPNDSELVLPVKMLKQIESACVSEEIVSFSDFVSKALVIDPDECMPINELKTLMEDEEIRGQYVLAGLIRYLKNTHGCVKTRRRIAGVRHYVITGVVSKTNKNKETKEEGGYASV